MNLYKVFGITEDQGMGTISALVIAKDYQQAFDIFCKAVVNEKGKTASVTRIELEAGTDKGSLKALLLPDLAGKFQNAFIDDKGMREANHDEYYKGYDDAVRQAHVFIKNNS